jgi:hypothetical protein
MTLTLNMITFLFLTLLIHLAESHQPKTSIKDKREFLDKYRKEHWAKSPHYRDILQKLEENIHNGVWNIVTYDERKYIELDSTVFNGWQWRKYTYDKVKREKLIVLHPDNGELRSPKSYKEEHKKEKCAYYLRFGPNDPYGKAPKPKHNLPPKQQPVLVLSTQPSQQSIQELKQIQIILPMGDKIPQQSSEKEKQNQKKISFLEDENSSLRRQIEELQEEVRQQKTIINNLRYSNFIDIDLLLS